MPGELGDVFATSLLQSAQSHSSAPPVVANVGDLSLGFAPGIFRGATGEDVRLYAVLFGRWIPGVEARLNASLFGGCCSCSGGAGVRDFIGGVSLFGVFVDEYPESEMPS